MNENQGKHVMDIKARHDYANKAQENSTCIQYKTAADVEGFVRHGVKLQKTAKADA